MSRSSFTRDVPIFGDRGGSGGSGPTPVAGTDRFEASIVVGNTLNGDPGTAQVGAFRYIPDTGDGAGIELALSEATTSGLPTRIRLRPGVYDFAAGGTTLPLTIPEGCTLEGSGEAVTVLEGTDADRAIFELEPNANLAALTIELPSAGVGATGDRIVLLDASSTVERVTLVVGDGAGDQDDDSLAAGFDALGSGARVLDCLVVINDAMPTLTTTPQIACYGIGPRGSGPTVSNVVIRGQAQGFGELFWTSDDAEHYTVDVQGACAASGTIAGEGGSIRIQSILQAGAATRPGTLQATGSDHQIVAHITDVDGLSVDGYIDSTAVRTRFTVTLSGAGVDGTVTDSGAGNTWAGSLDTPAVGEFVLEGEVIAVIGMRITGLASGDITFAATSLNCLALGNMISGVIANTAGGTGNQISSNLEGV